MKAGAALAGALLLFASDAAALRVREGFEWPWNPICVSPGTQGSSCEAVAGCGGGGSLFVRRTTAGACQGSDVRFWIGGSSRLHGGSVAVEPPPAAPAELQEAKNDWVAVHLFDPSFARPNDDTFEILSTRNRQRSRLGRLQVDLHVHDDVPESGGGEHYLVMHNLNLTGVSPCPSDGSGCPPSEHAGTSYGGIPSHPGSYLWYGVIAGSFGAGTDAIPFGSVGFAVEVSAPGAGGNHLVQASFLPYSVGGKQTVFPNGWYRIAIERSLRLGVDTYTYRVERWGPAEKRWAEIVPDDAASGRTGEVALPFSDLVAPLGFEIPLGYVGLAAAWFGDPQVARASHVDWDNLVVDW